MEAFEHLAKVALEAEGFLVTSNLKFPLRRRTKKRTRQESQVHGYEVDLIGARRNSLVLASVKSFFGSRGVKRQGFRGIADPDKRQHFDRYKLFNQQDVRKGVIREAARRFGYSHKQVELRLYVGKFKSRDEAVIRKHLGMIQAGAGPIKVIGLHEVLEKLWPLAESKTYYDDPVIVTLKALKAARRSGPPNTQTPE
jgi:hypothetical protein